MCALKESFSHTNASTEHSAVTRFTAQCVSVCVLSTVCVVFVRFNSGSLGGHSSACHLLNVTATQLTHTLQTNKVTVSAKIEL